MDLPGAGSVGNVDVSFWSIHNVLTVFAILFISVPECLSERVRFAKYGCLDLIIIPNILSNFQAKLFCFEIWSTLVLRCITFCNYGHEGLIRCNIADTKRGNCLPRFILPQIPSFLVCSAFVCRRYDLHSLLINSYYYVNSIHTNSDSMFQTFKSEIWGGMLYFYLIWLKDSIL